MSDFDRQIERELDRVLWPLAGAPIPAWRVPASPSVVKKVLGGAGAAIGAKLVTGFVVAALAAGAGVATEVAITGSLNPADWGQQVKQQVSTCKAALSTADHGIGECVSSFASQRGATRGGQKGAGEAGQSKTKSNNNNTDNPNSQDQGQQGPAKKTHEHPPWVRD